MNNKTKVEITLDGALKGKQGYVEQYFWEAGACFCVVVLEESIECVYIHNVKPIK